MNKVKYLSTNVIQSIYSFLTGRNRIGITTYASQNSAINNSGEVVSPEHALCETTIFTCVNIIGQGIAQLPLMNEPYMFKEPNEYQTQYGFVYSIIVDMLCYGNAYVRLVRSGNGKIKRLVPLDPREMDISVNTMGIPVYMLREDENVKFDYKDIVHIKDVSTHDVIGLSRVNLCAERIGCLKASDRQIAENFKNGVDIKYSVEINGNVDDEYKKRFDQALEHLFGSGGNKRGSAILLENGKLHQHKGQTVLDTDTREIRANLIKEISSVFRIPSYMVGTDGEQKYSNVRQNQTGLYRDTYLPIITQIEQAFAKKGIPLEFDVGGLLKGDIESQIRVVTQAVQACILTPNEAREYIGYDSIEGGDELMMGNQLDEDDQRGSETEPNAMNPEVTGGD